MSASVAPPAPDGTLPRGDAVRVAEAFIAGSRRRAWLDNLRHGLLVTAPWCAAVLFGGAWAWQTHAEATRPPPSPEVRVVFIDNGVQSRAELRENLPADRFALLVRNSIRHHLMARENYAWESVQQQYDQVSMTSTPDERDRYQALMNDKANPANPFKLYGEGVGAGKKRLKRYTLQLDPSAPFAASVVMVIGVQMPRQPECEVRKVARLTWIDARKIMPLDVQADYSPSGMAVSSYVSDPDPGAPPPANCPI